MTLRIFYYKIKIACLFGFTLAAITSCDYQEYADADYPEQKIYMPTANYNVYEIDKAGIKPSIHPTEGKPFRFHIDTESGKFIIPLGVYRAGIDNKGGFEVDITVSNDTIADLIAASHFTDPVMVLPSDKYVLPESITVSDGVGFQAFDLEVDLSFLQQANANNPTEKYAIAVEISSSTRARNPELSTTIILIDTQTSIP